jgi:hypothetical protein
MAERRNPEIQASVPFREKGPAVIVENKKALIRHRMVWNNCSAITLGIEAESSY